LRVSSSQTSLTALLLAVLLGAGAAPVHARAIRYADDLVAGQVNSTGRAIAMQVPLQDGQRKLGDVTVRIESDDTILVAKSSLIELLGEDLSPKTIANLAALPDLASLDALAKNGVPLKFDPLTQTLHTALSADQRKDGDISFAPQRPPKSAATAPPARISGYVNLVANTSHLWDSGQTSLGFSLNSALNWDGFVLENEARLQNDVNPQTCPSNGLCLFTPQSGLKRQGTRLVHDFPDRQQRLTIGDTQSANVAFGRANGVLGLRLEHAPQTFAPETRMGGTGSETFRLETAAEVDVVINGASLRHLQLPAGNYRLRDLPLQSGANDIQLVITEGGGAKRTERFSAFSGPGLLTPGQTEWSLAAGVPTISSDGGIGYVTDQFLASATGRYGVTTALTLDAGAQVDPNVRLLGGGAAWSTPLGIWGFSGAASHSAAGVGGSRRVTWQSIGDKAYGHLNLSAEFHTPEFRAPGTLTVNDNGVLLPVYQFKDFYAANYSLALPDNWQMALSGQYQVADPTYDAASPLSVHGDRYRIGLSASHPLFQGASLSGTLDYSNQIAGRSFTDFSALDRAPGDWHAGLRFSWQPSNTSSVSATADSTSLRSTLSATQRSEASGADSWSANVSVGDDRVTGQDSADATLSYHGQRASVSVGQSAGFTAFAPGGAGFAVGQQRTSLSVGSALVFADGRLALSAPIGGQGGFAILTPHASIAGKEVIVGNRDRPLAHSDGFGPAVVTGLGAYSAQTLPVDVPDLPPGYSLGTGGFDLSPGYRSGYALEVGSAYSVTLLGTLLDAAGAPLSLASGSASKDGHQVTLFTNQKGRFSADGLAPGEWAIEMGTEEGPLNYRVTVPEDTQGLFKAGELRPGKP
jgi:outer membrane usher protein